MFCDRIDTDEEDFDEEIFGLSDDEAEDHRPPPPQAPPAKKGPSKNVLRFRRELGKQHQTIPLLLSFFSYITVPDL